MSTPSRTLGSEAESARLASGLVALFTFACGAIGSALASMLFERCGWTLVASVAIVFPLIAFVHFLFVGRAHVRASR